MTRKQRRIVQWSIVATVALIGVWLTLAWSEPAPPSRITFAGGQRPSSYDDVATALATSVTADDGPAVDVRQTAGSVENL